MPLDPGSADSSAARSGRFRFGSVRFEPGRFELERDGVRVQAEPKVLRSLAYLIARRDEVVSKQELMDALWPGEFVSESAVHRNIALIRRAVGDDGKLQKVVRTLPRAGYRFVARVEWEADPMALKPFRIPLMGRKSELSELRSAFSVAQQGHSSILLICGEAGIGKTRLIQEFAHELRDQRAMLLESRCDEAESAPPFWIWTQLLRAQSLRQILSPEDLLPESSLENAKTTRGSAALEDRSLRFDAVVQALSRVSQDRPLLLLVDDLQWADPSSLALFEYFARYTRDARILTLCVVRTPDGVDREPFDAALGNILNHSNAHRIELLGLTESEIGEWMRWVTETDPDEDQVSALHARTCGNALYLSELLDSPESVIDKNLPRGLRATLHRRLSSLGQADRELLTRAAVLGQSFSLERLCGVFSLDTQSTLRWADRLIHHRVLEPGGELGMFQFSHALVRENLYADLTPSSRFALHRCIAESLAKSERLGSEDSLEEIAYHFGQVAFLGEVNPAIQYSLRAAYRANDRMAYEAACQHCTRALELESRSTTYDPKRHFEILNLKGQSEVLALERARARDTFTTAIELARKLDDANCLAAAVLGFSCSGYGDVSVPDEPAHALIEEALARLPKNEVHWTVRLKVRLSALPPYSDSMQERERLSHEALERARKHARAENVSIRMALVGRLFALVGPGQAKARLELADELRSIESAEDTRNPDLFVSDATFVSYSAEYGAALELGDAARAEIALTHTTRRGEQLGGGYRWWCLIFHAARAIAQGRIEEAERRIEAASSVGIKDQLMVPHIVIHGLRSWSALQHGTLHREALQVMSENLWATGAHMRVLGAYAWFRSGEKDRALCMLSALDAEGMSSLPRNEFWSFSTALLAEMADIRADPKHANALYQLLVPFQDTVLTLGAVHLAWGSAHGALGMLAYAAGRKDAGKYHLSAALTRDSDLGLEPALLRTERFIRLRSSN